MKREYMKELKEKKASRMKGLYQYNEIGTLEEEQGDRDEHEDAGEESKEERRAEKIIEALSGKNQWVDIPAVQVLAYPYSSLRSQCTPNPDAFHADNPVYIRASPPTSFRRNVRAFLSSNLGIVGN